ncbi:MAG: putative metal-binding motif-containing protein [Alphaproteobacteria bacterium]|nr:putative metal-binding motif-containing protein [Alphaproteobacteria bacterium]
MRQLLFLLPLIGCGEKDASDAVDSPATDSEPPCEALTWYVDADADGQGDLQRSAESCEPPSGYVSNADDCDDGEPTVGLGFPELCDDLDNDCDGLVDRGEDIVAWEDLDGDGFGDAAAPLYTICPHDGVLDDGDCDDDDADIHPGATEPQGCDAVDQDCDGAVDEGVGLVRYEDADGDGQGDPDSAQVGCPLPEGWVDSAEDCDDSDPSVCVGCEEVCDGKDNDCDGGVDASATLLGYSDADGDGFGDLDSPSFDLCDPGVSDDSDCDDADPATYPGASEACGDGVDSDCDGDVDCDDGDCLGDAACPTEAVCDDGVDDDSDGLVDCEDADCMSDAACVELTCDDGLDDDNDGLVDCDDDDCWGGGCGVITTQVTSASGSWSVRESVDRLSIRRVSSGRASSSLYRLNRYGHIAQVGQVEGVAWLQTASGASSSCGWTVRRFRYSSATSVEVFNVNGQPVSSSVVSTGPNLTRSDFALSSACPWTTVGSSALPQDFLHPELSHTAIRLASGTPWYVPGSRRFTSGGTSGGGGGVNTTSNGGVWSVYSATYSLGQINQGFSVATGSPYTRAWPP